MTPTERDALAEALERAAHRARWYIDYCLIQAHARAVREGRVTVTPEEG